MSYVKVMVHAVWGTKNHHPFLVDEIKHSLISHIKANASEKQIFIDKLNGYENHLHCLFGLNADMSISKTLQLIKGESAYWINKQKLVKSKFEWADEYYAVSVSESVLDNVRHYIDDQEVHHKKISFLQECDDFFRKYELGFHG